MVTKIEQIKKHRTVIYTEYEKSVDCCFLVLKIEFFFISSEQKDMESIVCVCFSEKVECHDIITIIVWQAPAI